MVVGKPAIGVVLANVALARMPFGVAHLNVSKTDSMAALKVGSSQKICHLDLVLRLMGAKVTAVLELLVNTAIARLAVVMPLPKQEMINSASPRSDLLRRWWQQSWDQ